MVWTTILSGGSTSASTTTVEAGAISLLSGSRQLSPTRQFFLPTAHVHNRLVGHRTARSLKPAAPRLAALSQDSSRILILLDHTWPAPKEVAPAGGG